MGVSPRASGSANELLSWICCDELAATKASPLEPQPTLEAKIVPDPADAAVDDHDHDASSSQFVETRSRSEAIVKNPIAFFKQ